MTLVSVTAYHSFGGEVEASNTPTIRRLTPSCRHQLLRIAPPALRQVILVTQPRFELCYPSFNSKGARSSASTCEPMKRRDFIALAGAAAAMPPMWPLAARAQQPRTAVIGSLYVGSPEGSTGRFAAFRQGLSEGGFVEGRNLAIEYRWANNDTARLPALAADLVRRRVAVIVTLASTAATLAAKAAT